MAPLSLTTILLALAPALALAGQPCRVFKKASHSREEVQKTIDAFLAAVGGVDNGSTPGAQGAGFRSVNWDAPIVPFLFPAQFFNLAVPRGLKYEVDGCDMAVSNPSPDDPTAALFKGDVRLDSFNRRNKQQFAPFSGERIFCPFEKSEVEAEFYVPGTLHEATTKAFGTVALDVDHFDRSVMTAYDVHGRAI